MNRVGSVRDVVMVAVFMLVFAMGFFVIHFFMTTAVDELVANPEVNASSEAVTAFEGVTEKVLPRLDYLVLVLFVGFVLAIMITGWFVGGYPIFAFIYFIVVVLTVVFSAVLSNFWEQVTTAAQFGTTISAFPIANNLMTYLPLYMGIVGVLGLVVMFAKPATE